jgi:hypothetical protein
MWPMTGLTKNLRGKRRCHPGGMRVGGQDCRFSVLHWHFCVTFSINWLRVLLIGLTS